ncbi:MAG: acyl-CoA carboxylase subunit beta [Acidimicrobiales bacterium]
MTASLVLRGGVKGCTSAAVERLGRNDAVVLRIDASLAAGSLTPSDSETIAVAAATALRQRLPLVGYLASGGASVDHGIEALHAWGRAARELTTCSGIVPVVLVCQGPAVSGPALLLGLADVVVMTADSYAFVSGPAMVREMTGVDVDLQRLGGVDVHARRTGVAALEAEDTDHAAQLVADVLDFLPPHADVLPPRRPTSDPPGRRTPELRDVIPAAANGSYDVRRILAAVIDQDQPLLELRPRWATQIVTALARLGGKPVGIVANQPQSMAGTIDIPASHKAARFVTFCDSFGLPIITLVDTPGFLPGKDLEWRGMIRHGAQMAFAYAEASVPRVCLLLRKAYGGAYIVMDCRPMGSDLCLAWPSAEVAVMGAKGAVQILHRRAGPAEAGELELEYEDSYLNPWIAAERGLIDDVIDPARTRGALIGALEEIRGKREHVGGRKHANGPL